jgi:hypothetical protein
VLGVASYRAGNFSGAADALEKAVQLGKGGDAIDWFFLAMTRWRLGQQGPAREWYDKAALWTEKNRSRDWQLNHFRGEAAELLGIKAKSTTESKEEARKE